MEKYTLTEYHLPSNDTIDDVSRDQLAICVRERKKDGSKLFNYEKRFLVEGEQIKEMRVLSAKEYVEYVRTSCPTMKPLKKLR